MTLLKPEPLSYGITHARRRRRKKPILEIHRWPINKLNLNDNVGLNSFWSVSDQIPSLHNRQAIQRSRNRWTRAKPSHRIASSSSSACIFKSIYFFISFKLPTITILILLKVINFYDPPAHNNHQIDRRLRGAACHHHPLASSAGWPPASHVAINTNQSKYRLSTHAAAYP